MIFCFQGLTVYGQSIGELKRKAEIQKLKADNYPKSELFFGANLNSNFGTVESTTNTINLESVSMEFDNFIPSFRVGYKYLLNPEKHHGLFFHFNRYSKKALKFSDSNDFNPAFDTSFNEIQAGVVYGKLQLGIGKILDDQVLSSAEQWSERGCAIPRCERTATPTPALVLPLSVSAAGSTESDHLSRAAMRSA